jgi:hypothetical protein
MAGLAFAVEKLDAAPCDVGARIAMIKALSSMIR